VCWFLTSTNPPSIHYFEMSRALRVVRCLAESKIRCKGKVESGIGHTQKTPLKGMRFESLEEAQAYLDRWEQRWADTRIHGTRNGRWRHVHRRKTALVPYSRTFATTNTENASFIWMVAWKSKLLLRLPPDGSGGREVQWMSCTCVSCIPAPANFFASTCAETRRVSHHREDHPKKMPSARRNFCGAPNMPEPDRQALPVDLSAGRDRHPPHPGNAILMKKYGAAAVEDACATALPIGVHQYRFVRRYLERRPHPQMFLRQIDP